MFYTQSGRLRGVTGIWGCIQQQPGPGPSGKSTRCVSDRGANRRTASTPEGAKRRRWRQAGGSVEEGVGADAAALGFLVLGEDPAEELAGALDPAHHARFEGVGENGRVAGPGLRADPGNPMKRVTAPEDLQVARSEFEGPHPVAPASQHSGDRLEALVVN